MYNCNTVHRRGVWFRGVVGIVMQFDVVLGWEVVLPSWNVTSLLGVKSDDVIISV